MAPSTASVWKWQKENRVCKKKQLLQILYTGIAVIFAKIDSLFGKKKGDNTQKASCYNFVMENSNFAKNSVKWGKVEYEL